MKRVGNFLLVVFFLKLVFSDPGKAQDDQSGMGMGTPSLIATPTFEAVEGGLKIEVWIMSKVKEGLEQGDAGTDEMKPATHNILVGIKDAASGNDLLDSDVILQILKASGKTETVQLELRSDQYGGGIPMEEKGEYSLRLNISTADGRKVETPFRYKVNR